MHIICWAPISECRVEALAVIEDFDIIKQTLLGLPCGWIPFMVEQFGFQGFPETLGDGIIITVASPTHALDHLVLAEVAPKVGGRILDAPIGMKHQAGYGAFPLPRLVEGSQGGGLGRHCGTERPADHLPMAEIQDDGEVLPPGLRFDVRDIGDPDPIGASDGKLLLQPVRSHRQRRIADRGPAERPLGRRPQPLSVHEPRHPGATDAIASGLQDGGDARTAIDAPGLVVNAMDQVDELPGGLRPRTRGARPPRVIAAPTDA